ncbi:type II toxin-antitoxin system RnlA family toxin [Rahnella variigena]|uniref:type II toxin-antitoxin system RnlA family toxin n=1 Tax=Rahnella variigena TaxID=574964 RepID=UPI00101BD1FB|nr:type II toxin-antitoxin system RnlA family toxin [Rahnella variigena]RYJ18132.1 type II toxin-antitoxin system RnlA family toxin [Rahnella variigena]
METEIDLTKLNLDRECVRTITDLFCQKNSLTIRYYGDKPGGGGLRIAIGKVGIDDATIDLFFIGDGTTTIQWKTGKNREIGYALAFELYKTINPDEFQTVNMLLKGITRQDIDSIIALLPEDDTKTFEIQTSQNGESIQWKIHCKEHSDSLTVTHHSSLKLQIQGKPLSCYRKLVYLLTDILDLASLEVVLSRTDENLTVVVRKEVAADYLKQVLPNSFRNLPIIIRDLLISGQCVKLAAPDLGEYSMLLFPELRSLEGALKAKLAEYGFDSDTNDFGYFFSSNRGTYELKASFDGHITDALLRSNLGAAYTFFNKHRHGLFHMESFVEASRKISGMPQLLTLSHEAYKHLDNIYK